MSSNLINLLLFLLASISASTLLANQSTQVLVVHAYSQEYPWTRSQHQGFTEYLISQSSSPVTISTEHLDTKRRHYSADMAQHFSSYLQQKYAGYKPDLIYVTDDNGYLFARDYLLKIFPSSVIFFSGVNNLDIARETLSLPVRGVFEKKDISKNIELIQQLDPKEKNILVLGDGSSTYKAIERRIREQLQSHSSMKASFLVSNNLEKIVRTIKNRKEKYLILTTIGEIRGENDQPLSLKTIIETILQASETMIISLEDAYLLNGVLGGLVTSGIEQGKSAAHLAIEYLDKGDINSIQNIEDSPNLYQFDKTKLSQHHIKLPDDIFEKARFHNIPPSFYERNRNLILLTITALSLMLVLLLGMLVISRRRSRQKSRQDELLHLARSESYQNAVLSWSSVSYDNVSEAFHNATKISAQTLNSERVSIWLYDDSSDILECQDIFSLVQNISPGMVLHRKDFPAYFKAMEQGRPLAIADALTDPVTADFVDVYLKPNRIQAMLDIPLYYNGELAGIFCFEHTGSVRQWQDYEIDFAATMASLVSLSLEVSKRKKIEQGLEEEVYKRTREAVHANAAKSAFLANMSHELRTPMHAILSYTSLILKSDLDEKATRFLNNIQTSAYRLTSLVDDLLDLSKLEAGKIELNITENNIADIIDTHVSEVESLIHFKNITSILEVEDPLHACFDSKLIGQVITNLLSNAIKFSPQDSEITIRAFHETRSIHDKPTDVLHLEVIDQGIGIPQQELDDIFDKFIQSSSTKTSSGGTGLGLSICKEIIELHHGEIWAESPAIQNTDPSGKGAAFHVIIPRN